MSHRKQQFTAIPFGLNIALSASTLIIKVMFVLLRELEKVNILAYLDDFLVLASSSEECRRHRKCSMD